jgi:glycosyltransferase involved in cell wall biosynthesis
MSKYFFIGNNSFEHHKRGVENVIEQQMNSLNESIKFYLHWGNSKNLLIKKRANFIDVALPKNKLKAILYINIILFKYYNSRKIIISHNYLMSVFILFRINVFTVHDGLLYQNRKKRRNFFLLIIFFFIEKFVYWKSMKLHFVSFYTKNKSLYNGSNCEVIYNNCRFELININNVPNCDFILKKYNIFNLIVRSIEERAHLEVIIRCAELNPLENFVIAGKGPLLDYYIRLCSNYKNIHFTGFVDDSLLVQLYKNCKSVIVPANSAEGFGLPVIEGYYFNKVVFASKIGALPEVIYSKEYLFEDANELCDKLQNINYEFNPVNYYYSKYAQNIIHLKYSNIF